MSDIAQFTSVFRAQSLSDQHRKVTKRNRQPVSCLACRARKLKCSRTLPCAACTKRGDGDACKFGPSPPSNNAGASGWGQGGSRAEDANEAQLEIGIEFNLDLRQEDLEIIKELGHGNGGTVSKIKHLPTGTTMARKVRTALGRGTGGRGCAWGS